MKNLLITALVLLSFNLFSQNQIKMKLNAGILITT